MKRASSDQSSCSQSFSFFQSRRGFAAFALFLLLFAFSQTIFAAPSDIDFSFGSKVVDGDITKSVVQPDGKILIGGEFTFVGGYDRNYIARLNADGTTDATFNANITSTLTSSGNIVGNVVKLALQTDGKIIIAGSFTSVSGKARSKITRLNVDGTLDPTFLEVNIGSGNLIYALALQTDGKILISGNFSSVNGNSTQTLARLNADGSFDSTFQNPLYSSSNAFVSILPLPDGKILIGGSFSFVNQQYTSIARLNNNGTIDQTFQTPVVGGGNARVTALITQTDDKILIAGDFNSVGGQTRKGLARLNSDGTLDTTFQDPNVLGNAGALNLAIQKDGKIIIVGLIYSVGGQARNGVARINADGTLDTTFGDINAPSNAVVIQPDGKILIGGGFPFVSGRKQPYISRLLGTPAAQPQKPEFDFDNDAKADAAVFRDGVWYINRSTLGFLAVQFGLATDKPAPADFDGDGKTDIAVFRSENGFWYILQSSNNQVRYFQFGLGTDSIVAADYDADGKTDIAVFRNGIFYIFNSSNNQISYQYFGGAGDVPIASAYIQ